MKNGGTIGYVIYKRDQVKETLPEKVKEISEGKYGQDEYSVDEIDRIIINYLESNGFKTTVTCCAPYITDAYNSIDNTIDLRPIVNHSNQDLIASKPEFYFPMQIWIYLLKNAKFEIINQMVRYDIKFYDEIKQRLDTIYFLRN
ncbi:MAG: hypothetical protein LBN27_13415 [Prevotellaceae bacterium]|nr:hypothetical protein [Prevotellaceae bacterium]